MQNNNYISLYYTEVFSKVNEKFYFSGILVIFHKGTGLF